MRQILILAVMLTGCAKYQVVQEIKVNMYHMHNPKSHKTEVILTEQQLKVGAWYRLKSIDIIDLEKQ